MDEQRRLFVGWLATLPFWSLVWGVAQAAQVEAAEPQPQWYQLNEFFVAGFQFYEGVDLIEDIKVGDRFELIPEPENAYDSLAVRIEYQGVKIGYIPRRENKTLHLLLRQGAKLHAEAIYVAPEEMPWEMLELRVRYKISA
ncbi:MAG TPA: HIRAN domain-containing protein [Acidobacteriota bacterium]|nr:HIRAN domain-containing protein [Acidobacteriota bacterium]